MIEIWDRSQITTIWLAEMSMIFKTRLYFSQSDEWDLILVSILVNQMIEIWDRSQITTIWLAEMSMIFKTRLYFSQSDEWDLILVSILVYQMIEIWDRSPFQPIKWLRFETGLRFSWAQSQERTYCKMSVNV
jgi:hypothetical protein